MIFKGICLNQESESFLHISYKLDVLSKDLNTDLQLGNRLFGAVKLTRMLIQINANIAATAKDVTLVQNFLGQMEIREEMSLFWG